MADERHAEERYIITVFFPETEWQGDLIVQELKSAGIEAYLANRSSVAAWSDVMPLVKLEVVVPEKDAEKARGIIDEFLKEKEVVSESELEIEAEQATDPVDDQ
jgi:hypothetical protein